MASYSGYQNSAAAAVLSERELQTFDSTALASRNENFGVEGHGSSVICFVAHWQPGMPESLVQSLSKVYPRRLSTQGPADVDAVAALCVNLDAVW